jgi:hypothetical protein
MGRYGYKIKYSTKPYRYYKKYVYLEQWHSMYKGIGQACFLGKYRRETGRWCIPQIIQYIFRSGLPIFVKIF